MKTSTLSISILLFFCLWACDDNSSSYSSYSANQGKVDYSRTEREIKTDLKTREQMNPTNYLSTDGTYRKNLIGQTVIEGTISNSATLASFKDFTLSITGYSKTQSKVGTWQTVIYEVVRPGRTVSFKTKLELPRSVKTVGWEVQKAIALK